MKTKLTDFQINLKKSFDKHKKVALLFFSSILFGLDNFITAWFLLVPVFFLIDELKLKNAWVYGGVYGIVSCFFYATWLFVFSFPAMICIWILYFFLYAFLFEVLKVCNILLKNHFYCFFYVLIYVAFEYIRTLGFAGFSYGINGYTQYKNIYLIQIAGLFGVFSVSFVLYLCSAIIYRFLKSFREKNIGMKEIYSVVFYQLFVVSVCVYGLFKVNIVEKRDSESPKIKVSAIQHNTNPEKNDFSSYKRDLESLIHLTDDAISKEPDISLVVWSETSVVPSILKNYENSSQPSRKAFVDELLNFIDSKKCAFVIGNFHSENENDYNSAYFFESEKNVIPPKPEVYRKMHLVPFSEYLPFSEKLPDAKKYINSKNNFLWTPGTDLKIFSLKTEFGDFKFFTPICFEDTFGNDLRKSYKKGARAFINLSNDSWSKSKRCQVQHLKMAVFRSVENHVPSVRSTASGETCVISSTGKIIARSESFKENYVISEIPILK